MGHLVQDIVVALLALFQIRGILQNAVPRPGELIACMHLRLFYNNLLSPLAGLVLCVYKLATDTILGHDVGRPVCPAV